MSKTYSLVDAEQGKIYPTFHDDIAHMQFVEFWIWNTASGVNKLGKIRWHYDFDAWEVDYNLSCLITALALCFLKKKIIGHINFHGDKDKALLRAMYPEMTAKDFGKVIKQTRAELKMPKQRIEAF